MSPRTWDLCALLASLKRRNYHFITPTPLTHARVLARPSKAEARDLRDVFGWSLPFKRDTLDAEILALMERTCVLETRGDLFASTMRVSSRGEDLFLHSAYPTKQQDAVFFGPDSYRFADFLEAELPRLAPRERLVDIGAGSGIGAIVAARLLQTPLTIVTDINPNALDLAAANCLFADVSGGCAFHETDGLNDIEGAIDLIIANPPYIIDAAHRTYRDGGALHGAEISLAWAKGAAEKLTCGGALALYTGSAIVDGEDRFKTALLETLAGFDVRYRELDPDVFGEELDRADYADVERIAVVGVIATKR